MRVTIVQASQAWLDAASNWDHLDMMLRRSGNLPATDLVVLPEMFSTGFVTRPEGVAETDGASLEWMKALAREGGFAVAGSVAVCEDGRYYNRLYFVTPDGGVSSYDKRHLFTYAGEHLRYTPGTGRTIVQWKGVRILLQVCYDLRFPMFSRNCAGEQGYDAAIYVASWPEQRSEAWKTLLRARAIENQCFVIAVNRCGADPSNRYSGDSAVLDWNGIPLAACIPGKESVAEADIDIDALARARLDFPVLDDRDSL